MENSSPDRGAAFAFSGSAQLAKAYQTAGILFEVLTAVNKSEQAEPPPEVSVHHQIYNNKAIFEY